MTFRITIKHLALVGAALTIASVHAQPFDNRFIPWIPRHFVFNPCRPSHVAVDFIAATALLAIGNDETEVPLPAIDGILNQASWGRSFTEIGLTNPLLVDFANYDNLIWNIEGKLQAHGFAFYYEQSLTDWLSLGIDMSYMKVRGTQDYFLAKNQEGILVTPAQIRELDSIRRSMTQSLGLCCYYSQQNGLNDLDLYFKAKGRWCYVAKMRTIDTTVRVGIWLPNGERRLLDEPPSIPFGGDGLWGMYGRMLFNFEIKEDMWLGVEIGISQRSAAKRVERVPLGTEPRFLGVIKDDFFVEPGITAFVSPSFVLENLRGGLGAGIAYTITYHERDRWCDARALFKQDQMTPNLETVVRRAGWASEYLTVNVFYDFARDRADFSWMPVAQLSADIPMNLLVAHWVPKLYKVNVGVEISF